MLHLDDDHRPGVAGSEPIGPVGRTHFTSSLRTASRSGERRDIGDRLCLLGHDRCMSDPADAQHGEERSREERHHEW